MSGLKKQFEAEARAKLATEKNTDLDRQPYYPNTSQRSERQLIADTRTEQLQSKLQSSFQKGANLHARRPKPKKK